MTTLTVAHLRRAVTDLTNGQKIRATFTDGTTAVGVLRGPSIVSPPSPELTLDSPTAYRKVRTPQGKPGPGLVSVEPWDEDARFDLLEDWMADYRTKDHAARSCPKSEQGWREKEAAEAKAAIIAEFLRGPA